MVLELSSLISGLFGIGVLIGGWIYPLIIYWNVFEPIVRAYNRYLFDPYMTDITEFKGGSSVGSDWVSRHLQTTVHYAKERYGGLLRRFEEVNLTDLLTDNWVRLVLLNGLDRVSVIRQSFGMLKNRFVKPDSTSYAFTEVTRGGLLFNGWLKGSLLNVLQFTSVVYPALYFANRVEAQTGRFAAFAGYYTLFDTLLYPLDRLKTLLYADTIGAFQSNTAIYSEFNKGWRQNSSGLLFKLLYNVPWLWTVYTTVNDTSEAHKLASWATLALLYPLTVAKTQAQLLGSSLTLAKSYKIASFNYRGVIPYMTANAIAHVTLYNLTGASKKIEYGQQYISAATQWTSLKVQE